MLLFEGKSRFESFMASYVAANAKILELLLVNYNRLLLKIFKDIIMDIIIRK